MRKHAKEAMGIDLPNTQQYEGSQEHQVSPPVDSSHRRGGSRLSLTIPSVCEDCNTGWMHDLEDESKPILQPMIEGKALKVPVPAQRVLFAWATKTALNFALFSEPDFRWPVPSHLAHELYAGRATHEPIDHVGVWVTAYEPLGQFAYRFMAARGYGRHPTTGRFHKIVRVVFIAGHVAFYVRLPDHEDAQGMGWRDPLPNLTELRVGPNAGPIKWRRRSIDDANVSETFKSAYPWRHLPRSGQRCLEGTARLDRGRTRVPIHRLRARYTAPGAQRSSPLPPGD
jgi:hypothetical protein